MTKSESCALLAEYLERYAPSLVILSGREKGTEFALGQRRLTLGRGPGVDLAVDDGAMAREHAAIEFGSEGFQIQSLNGQSLLLNGGEANAARLKDGDRFSLGEHTFQFVCPERPARPCSQ
jgi:predicted component of type VI protein secretion system